MLQVKNINFRFTGTKKLLLNKISFEVQASERLYICGESGTGKSTLLKIIYGFLDASSGIIRLNGERIFGPKYNLVPGHNHIKLVDQEFKLLPNHTVFENIIHHLNYQTAKQKKQRAQFLAENLQLEKLLKKFPRELSGGEKQRISIAQALALPPALLLLDEPFAHLDYQTQETTQQLVNQLLEMEKIASITVTHNPFDALKNAHRILFFDSGNIIDEATPNELYFKPKTLKSALFFGPIIKLKKGYLRPEHWFESPTGTDFTITAKFLHGPFFEYQIKQDKNQFLWFTQNGNYQINQQVKLGFKEENLIEF